MERGSHTGAGLLAGCVIPWGTHAGVACEELQLVSYGRDPMLEQGSALSE